MIIKNWEAIPTNKIEEAALDKIEASIVETSDYGPRYYLKNSRLARLALALDTELCDVEDYNIIEVGEFIEVEVKEEGKWKPSVPIIPRNIATFYAAYILENNEALKRAFFKEIRRSEKYGTLQEAV